MNDLAMDNASNYDESRDYGGRVKELQDSVEALELQAKFAKKFMTLYEDDLFKEVILDTLLGTEMSKLAESLVAPHMDEEGEANALTILRSLRYLNKFLEGWVIKAEHADDLLARNKKLLHETMAENEDY